MTDEEAIEIARSYAVAVRIEVRSRLLRLARERHPRTASRPESTVIRKLYDYPTDLSESRLLSLIEE